MNSEEYIPLLLSSWVPVHTLLNSILNHFLSSLIMPVAPGMIVLVISSVYGRMSAVVRSEHVSYDRKYLFNNMISFLFYIITNFSLLNSCCLLL